jgi:hypothetical protein
MAIEVMLDLETMGVHSDAPVVSIGAVKFDPRGTVGQLGDASDPEYKHFHVAVDLYSLEEAGFRFSGQTLKWWLQQSDAARKALLGTEDNPPVHIATALSLFYQWFGDESLPTWGNGAGFDNVILRNAYERMGGACPFKFSHDRCFRTMKALFPDVPFALPMVAHDAQQDAEAQAFHLQKLFNRINFQG